MIGVICMNNYGGLDQNIDRCYRTQFEEETMDSTKDRKSVLGVGNEESKLIPRFGV